MTSTPDLLGPDYDSPAQLPDSLSRYETKRSLVLRALKRAEADGDESIMQLMFWELGLIDVLVTNLPSTSLFGGGTYEAFAEFYRFTDQIVAYARARANETNDVVLRVHYLTFVLARIDPTGRDWIESQRELASTLRDYVNGCQKDTATSSNGYAGVHIDRALALLRPLVARPGVIPGMDAEHWAIWVVSLAEASRALPEPDERRREAQRHRWIASYLSVLTELPAAAASPDVRIRALTLITDAASYYRAVPLLDDFERAVNEAEAALRRHWGEPETHKVKTRRAVDSLRRRAEFHRGTGNGSLTAHFFREARRLVAEQRQYFTAEDVADLQRAEQAALAHSVAAGEYARLQVPLSISADQMDLTKESSPATVAAIIAFAARSVPGRSQLRAAAEEMSDLTPLRTELRRTIIGQDKVVGETQTPEKNLELDVEFHAVLLARMTGAVVGTTAIRAAGSVSLVSSDLLSPLKRLNLEQGSLEMIEQGCARLIEEDFVSAVHILVPRFEDALRQHLRAVGVDTTRFNPDVGDGTSRTDDAPLGALLRASLPDGRSVREYFGSDLWDHVEAVLNSQTGLNLRNDVAHGLLRPSRCTVEIAGLALALLYQLAAAAV